MSALHFARFLEPNIVIGLRANHRIIDDRIEKSIKGRRIGHCAFATSIFKV